MTLWFYAFVGTYLILMAVLYLAYGKKTMQKVMGKNMYLHYHIIDSGEIGDRAFTKGENVINGVSRVYNRECVINGTLFYEDRNAEPLKVVRSVSDYKYFCDTKNFDTVSRNTILQTLMVLRAKDIILMVIIAGIMISIVCAVGVGYVVHSDQKAILDALGALAAPNALETP
jgi:hypothetical protein